MKTLILLHLLLAAPVFAMELSETAAAQKKFNQIIEERHSRLNYDAIQLDSLKSIIDRVDIGTQKNCYGYSALILAIMRADCDLAELLIQHGANPNKANPSDPQLTPLMWTVFSMMKGNNHMELYFSTVRDSKECYQARVKLIAQLLIQAGANIDQKVGEGTTTAIDHAKAYELDDFANFLQVQSEEFARNGKLDLLR